MLFENFVDFVFALGLLVNAVLFVAQAIKLIKIKKSDEVSLIMLVGFWLIQLATVLHGYISKDYLLLYGTLLSMVTCGHVIWLTIYYRGKKTYRMSG